MARLGACCKTGFPLYNSQVLQVWLLPGQLDWMPDSTARVTRFSGMQSLSGATSGRPSSNAGQASKVRCLGRSQFQLRFGHVSPSEDARYVTGSPLSGHQYRLMACPTRDSKPSPRLLHCSTYRDCAVQDNLVQRIRGLSAQLANKTQIDYHAYRHSTRIKR